MHVQLGRSISGTKRRGEGLKEIKVEKQVAGKYREQKSNGAK